jgi:anthranilate phosphoribosyltransferase
MRFPDILLCLCRKTDLSEEQSRFAFSLLMTGTATDAQIGGFLVGLAAKGSTVDELVGAASVMRDHVVPVPTDPNDVILDTCGTGGDVKGTFNISTAAAIVAAAAGVKVVKHGNRSASGKTGSADVLEALGVRLDTTPEIQARCLKEVNLCFAFARGHHPAMKHVAAARASLGIPTLFNLLGPLTNPAGAKHQLLGVFAPELTEKLACVLHRLGSVRAWVVHAEDGLDEISTTCPTRVSELRDGRVTSWTLDPTQLGLPRGSIDDLRVHGVEAAADAIRQIVAGRPGPMRDITLLNAAAAMVVAGLAPDLPQALNAAARAIDSGRAAQVVNGLSELSSGQSRIA